MKKLLPLLALAVFLAVLGISKTPEFNILARKITSSSEAAVSNARTFKASLTGDQEVPPVSTVASGNITLRFDASTKSVKYKLKVTGTDDVTAAHLHLGKAGQNGDVVVSLNTSGATRPEGQTTFKTFSKADLTGPLAGMTVGDLAEKIKSGDIYVNVHTSQIPSGFIRGQVR